MSRLFDLDWQLAADSVLSIIAVFALFLILSYLLFNPARAMLQARKDRIREQLGQTQSDMDKASKLRKEYEERLAQADKEAEGILAKARSTALENEGRILAQAKEEAARIVENARREAALEKSRLADEVKKEMVQVASLLAGRLVKSSLDAQAQDALIEETLRELGEGTWQK